jgi:predicted enzyme related to lactoylglutathione lyase
MAAAMNPISWFEIPVNDMDRAKSFYEGVLGIRLTPFTSAEFDMTLFPSVQGAAGAAGALMKARSYVPSHSGALVYFSVEDIEATLERVERFGGKILNPKTGIGQFGFVGHFEDCEGNRVALHATG